MRGAVAAGTPILVQPGAPLRPAAIYDTNGAIVTAAVTENGGEAAFLGAIRDGRIVRIRLERPAAREIHPVMLIAGPDSWQVVDAAAAFEAIPLAECGSINISARRFSATAR